MSLQVEPATADRWEDVVIAFGRRGDDPGWCWCQLFLHSQDELSIRRQLDNRSALHREISSATTPPGLIAYLDGRPVGWTRVGPRSKFPGVRNNRSLARVLTNQDNGVWWVTCFAVDSRHRGIGIGQALLEAAVEFARSHGATMVEAHPVDVAALKAGKASGSAVYPGTATMFTAAGFVEIARTTPARPVMRRTFLAPRKAQ